MKKFTIFPIVSFLLVSSIFNQSYARRRRKVNPVAKAWLVVSLDGKTVFDSKNADKVRSIASLSKMMATLVIVESGLILKKKTKLIPHDWAVAKGGCRTRLKRNHYYSNKDLLHAALMGSDNRAIPALGRAVGLNVGSLVRKMNRRARLMGLKHTHFKEPTGISHDNVSTAKEILVILRAVSRNRVISSIMKKATYTVIDKKSKRRIVYNNTNILTRRHTRKILAGKTGFNNPAGYCLATAIYTKSMGKVAYIILGSTGKLRRFSDFHILNRRLSYKAKLIGFKKPIRKLAKKKIRSVKRSKLVKRKTRKRRRNRAIARKRRRKFRKTGNRRYVSRNQRKKIKFRKKNKRRSAHLNHK